MKRTLVISNAAFSKTTSNGRTLERLFDGYDKDSLAQFYTYGEPDFEFCDNYYHVSDRDALKSLIKLNINGQINDSIAPTQADLNPSDLNKKRQKTPLDLLIRECVWEIGHWDNKILKKWIDSFNPEQICVFVANNIFLLELATKLAAKREMPIYVYSTEAYYFMDFNYLKVGPDFLFKLHWSLLRKSYKAMSKYVNKGYFNSNLLADTYSKEFGYACSCIMNDSEINYQKNYAVKPIEETRVSYLGNLGIMRHKALIEIATELQKIDRRLKLDVYGKIPNENVRGELEACQGINYKGMIPYDEVVEVIHASSLLVHAEYNSPQMNRELKYGFSTKIADSIASGTPLLMYASDELISTKFLCEEQCAFVAQNRKMLAETLLKALFDEVSRKNVAEKAINTSSKYMRGNAQFISEIS